MSEELSLSNLKPAQARKDRKRVGRGLGSGKGRYSGRGIKGQKSRSGSHKMPAGFEGGQMPMHMRLPKLKGFKNRFRVEYQVVNLDKLAELYPQGGEVTKADLVAKGAVRKNELVKVLGTGEISVAINVKVDAYSASAKEKITAAGGSAEELSRKGK
jgi:large subunit ribosomal protein L15